MNITQNQFNEIVYWTRLAIHTQKAGSSKQKEATYFMMKHYGETISLKIYLDDFLKIGKLGSDESICVDKENILNKQDIVNAFNKVLDTNYNFTLDETNRPNLLMYALTVHGTTLGAGLAALILSCVLAPSLAPVGWASLVGVAIILYPQLLPLWRDYRYDDGLGDAIMYIYGLAIIGLVTVVTLINTPILLLSVLSGAVAGAILYDTASSCGTKFFNLPKHTPIDSTEDIINATPCSINTG